MVIAATVCAVSPGAAQVPNAAYADGTGCVKAVSDCGTTTCPVCGRRVPCCDVRERTLMVPMKVVETRMKPCVVKTMKEREETYTTFKLVPEEREYKRKTCYLALEVKSQEITKKQCRTADVPVTLSDEVRQPVRELREGVRRREVCTKCGKVCVEEPCTCVVNRTVDVPRERTYCRKEVVFEECKKTIDYCVKTPKFEEEVCAVEKSYRLEPVEKKRTVQVCVPEIVQKPTDYCVTRMVQKKVVSCSACYEAMVAEAKRAQQCDERHAKMLAHAQKAGGKMKKVAEHTKECAAKFAPQKVASCLAKHVVALNPLKLLPFECEVPGGNLFAGHKKRQGPGGRSSSSRSCETCD